MKRIVPYGIRIGAEGRIETWPIVHVQARAEEGDEVPLILVIDSGATTTLLPSIDAEALGVVFESGKRILVRGISGDALTGYRHHIALRIEGLLLPSVPVIFAEPRNVPRVLGREGVFSHLAIVFDEAKHRVGLLLEHQERRAIDRFLRK